MKNIQVFVCLLVMAEPIFTSSVSKKLKPKEHKDVSVINQPQNWIDSQAQSRLSRAAVAIQPVPATAVVLQPAYYQPKIDSDLLNNQADLGSYAALVGPETYGFDISKTFALKGYQPQYGLGKYTEVVYKPEAVAVAKDDHHYAIPESYVTLLHKHGDDHHDSHDKHHSYASSYQFGYRVKDPYHGSYFGHSEVSDGHVKKGQYHVLLPDGRLQNVKYQADHSGYHATVTYEGTKYYVH